MVATVERNNEIQMQASNRRSSWSAESSVQQSNQNIKLASEALREPKRAGRRARVVRESSFCVRCIFLPFGVKCCLLERQEVGRHHLVVVVRIG